MNNFEDRDPIAQQLREWSLVEPPVESRAAIDSRSLTARIGEMRVRRQRVALGLASIVGLAALFVFHRSPANLHTAAAPHEARPHMETAQSHVLPSAGGEDLATQLGLQLAESEEQIGELRSRLERLQVRVHAQVEVKPLGAFEQQDSIAERYYAARRQRVQERVLDDWLARNP